MGFRCSLGVYFATTINQLVDSWTQIIKTHFYVRKTCLKYDFVTIFTNAFKSKFGCKKLFFQTRYFLSKFSYYIFESSETCCPALTTSMGSSSQKCSSLALELVPTGCTTLTAFGFLGLAWLVVMLNNGSLTKVYSSGHKKHPTAFTKWLLQTLYYIIHPHISVDFSSQVHKSKSSALLPSQ